MRTLGLIGGCSAEATTLYYEGLNRGVRSLRPGHGAKLLLWSFDVEEIDVCCRAADWTTAFEKFREAGFWLQDGGAQAILLATNTMHKIADELAGTLSVPLIHIGDVAAQAVLTGGCHRPLLLGTRYLMEDPFYRERLEARGLDVVMPDRADGLRVHDIIYGELMEGRVSPEARSDLATIVERATDRGADSVILACTELGLAVKAGEVEVPVFDTASLHIEAGIAFALADPESVSKGVLLN